MPGRADSLGAVGIHWTVARGWSWACSPSRRGHSLDSFEELPGKAGGGLGIH